MKTSEAKRKPVSQGAKASREVGTGTRAQGSTRPFQVEQPRAGATDGTAPMPDLGKYGIVESAAREHVRQCESCGRAHKHVVKNPRDAMALDTFGRHMATCLAVQATKTNP